MTERESLLDAAVRKLELRVAYASETRGEENYPHITQAEAAELLRVVKAGRRG